MRLTAHRSVLFLLGVYAVSLSLLIRNDSGFVAASNIEGENNKKEQDENEELDLSKERNLGARPRQGTARSGNRVQRTGNNRSGNRTPRTGGGQNRASRTGNGGPRVGNGGNRNGAPRPSGGNHRVPRTGNAGTNRGPRNGNAGFGNRGPPRTGVRGGGHAGTGRHGPGKTKGGKKQQMSSPQGYAYGYGYEADHDHDEGYWHAHPVGYGQQPMPGMGSNNGMGGGMEGGMDQGMGSNGNQNGQMGSYGYGPQYGYGYYYPYPYYHYHGPDSSSSSSSKKSKKSKKSSSSSTSSTSSSTSSSSDSSDDDECTIVSISDLTLTSDFFTGATATAEVAMCGSETCIFVDTGDSAAVEDDDIFGDIGDIIGDIFENITNALNETGNFTFDDDFFANFTGDDDFFANITDDALLTDDTPTALTSVSVTGLGIFEGGSLIIDFESLLGTDSIFGCVEDGSESIVESILASPSDFSLLLTTSDDALSAPLDSGFFEVTEPEGAEGDLAVDDDVFGDPPIVDDDLIFFPFDDDIFNFTDDFFNVTDDEFFQGNGNGNGNGNADPLTTTFANIGLDPSGCSGAVTADPEPIGIVTIDLNFDTICFDLTTSDTSSPVTDIEIHEGDCSGPILATLLSDASNSDVFIIDCFVSTVDVVARISNQPRDFCFKVATETNPPCELGGLIE